MTEPTYWDKGAAKYAKKPIADMPAYLEKLTYVQSAVCKTDNVLEIGCGTGGTAIQIAPFVAQMTATDGSAEMIRIAHSKREEIDKSQVVFVQADAAAPVAGAPFDVVCAFSVLHLVGNINEVLNTVAQQLKPNGLFISKTACLKHRSLAMRGIVRLMTALRIAPRVTFLSEKDLVKHLRQHGFEVETIKYFGAGRMSPCISARKVGHEPPQTTRACAQINFERNIP